MIIRNIHGIDYLTIYRKEDAGDKVKYVPSNDMILVNSVSGFGKTLAVEKIAHSHYKKGATVINLNDVKNNFENCFCCLPPNCVPDYHRYKVEIIQKQKLVQIPTKIYHPFTFDIPFRRTLPDINFFTIPLKSFTEEHCSFLTETSTMSDSVKLIIDGTSKLKPDQGLYDFIRTTFSLVEEKTSFFHGKKIKKINEDMFFTTESSSGTAKDTKNIGSTFKPFINDYFLASENCKHNIDFEKMINDNRNYHCLSCSWIKSTMIKYFVIVSWLIGIKDALEKGNIKHPLCIIIDEIRKLVPDKEVGYKKYMAKLIKDLLSTIRSTGAGVVVICGSQVFMDIDEDVRNSFTEILFGNLATSDVERLSKVYNWNGERRKMMISLKRNHFHRRGDESDQGGNDQYTIPFPEHAHKEADMNFFEEYHKYYPFLEKKYTDLFSEMKARRESEETKAKKEAVLKDREMKENLRKMEEEREQKSDAVKKLELIKQVQKEQKSSSKDTLQKKCYDMYVNFERYDFTKRPSFRDIARKIGNISFPTVKTYILEYDKKLKQEQQDDIIGDDFERKEEN